MLRIQLGWLQTFIVVYHTGSFTKAAGRLDLTQPAVTQQIRGLEKKLGKSLFERTPRGALPTPEGKALAHEIEGSIAELSSVVSRRFAPTPSARPIRIGGPAELVTARVMPSISVLVAEGLNVHFTLDTADNLLADLRAGHLDLVVSTIQPRMRGLEGTPLTDEEFALLASPRVAARVPKSLLEDDGPAALDVLPMIAYAETLPIVRRYWLTVFDTLPSRPPAVVVPDLRAVISALTGSAGISVLPTYLCGREMREGRLVTLLNPDVPPINTFYLVTRSGTLGEPSIAGLHDHLLTESKSWT